MSGLTELWGAEHDWDGRVGETPPNFELFEPSELPHADAEFDPVENVLRIDDSVWDAACVCEPESRWILAHEIGHVWLGHYAAAGLYGDEYTIVDPDTDSEHQANRFADELLMDDREIDPSADGYAAIMRRFRVTQAMATRRLRELAHEGRAKRAL